MRKFVVSFISNAIGLLLAVWIIDGIHVLPQTNQIDYIGTVLIVSLILTLLNMIVRPILKVLTLPLIILTLGLFCLVINTGMLILTSKICEYLRIGFTVENFWAAFFGALIILAAGIVIQIICAPFVPFR